MHPTAIFNDASHRKTQQFYDGRQMHRTQAQAYQVSPKGVQVNEQTRKALEMARASLENFWLTGQSTQSERAEASQAIAAIDAALSAPAAPVAQTVIELTDDMLRYAMAALGTGSPKEAQKFRLFWHFATEAMSSAPAATVAQPLTDEVVQALLEALRECLTCEFPVTDKAAICKAEAAIAKAAGWRT